MHTNQIADKVLDNYSKEKLTEERITFLKKQAEEQLAEIKTNEDIYNSFLEMSGAPENVDPLILWILFMLNEDIVDEYVDEFSKPFREIIPVSDLADLVTFVIHKKKIEGVDIEGIDFLLEYDHAGKDEVDQYAFTNVLLYVEKTKQPQIDF